MPNLQNSPSPTMFSLVPQRWLESKGQAAYVNGTTEAHRQKVGFPSLCFMFHDTQLRGGGELRLCWKQLHPCRLTSHIFFSLPWLTLLVPYPLTHSNRRMPPRPGDPEGMFRVTFQMMCNKGVRNPGENCLDYVPNTRQSKANLR